MTSEDTDTNMGAVDETSPAEHDYAHAAANNSTSTEATSPSVTPATDGGVIPRESPTADAGASVPPRTEGDTRKSPARRRGPRRHKQPEDTTCCTCKVAFERRGRGFNRRAVFTFTNPETVHWVFPDSAAQDRSFLCETCAQVIRNTGKRKQCSKRTVWLKPVQQPEGKDKKKKKKRTMGKKSKAAMLVSKSSYKAAFKMLWSSKGARKNMMEFWTKQLKQEMKALTRHTDSPFKQKVSSMNPLSSFPWRRCLSWAQDKAPLVTSCLTSLFPDINSLFKSSHQMSEEMAETLVTRRVVLALSIPLFTRNIWKNNFLQAALGAELRMQGCSCPALDILNTMGLCQTRDTVRSVLFKLQNGKKTQTLNGRQRILFEQIKEEHMMYVDEGNIEEEEEVVVEEEEEEEEEEDQEEGEDDDDEEGDEDEEDEEEEEGEDEEGEKEVDQEEDDGNMEEVEEEEVQDEMLEEAEEVQAVEEKRGRKRKERGMVKVKEEEDGGLDQQQKKRRVVVVRLGLLKGHSEVGRSDLSAP